MADDAGLAVLLGNGDGTFQQPEQVVTGLDPVSLAAGDFTGDGKLDLATANTDATISIVLGNGDGSFQPQEEFSAGFPPSSQLGQLVTGDFNGDGRLDLAYLDEGDFIGLDNGGVYVALGNGNGTFQPAREVAVLDQPTVLVAGYFTGDEKLDLVVADDNGIEILLGNGDGTFQPPRMVAMLVNVTDLLAADFSGDGKLDLAVESVGGDDSDLGISVLLGNGDGTFQAPISTASTLPFPGFSTFGANPAHMLAGDFTGDGRLDIVWWLDNSVEPGSPGLNILLGNGDGTFQPNQQFAQSLAPFAAVAGDFAGEGKLGLAVLGHTTSNYNTIAIFVLAGDGDGTFQPPQTFTSSSLDGFGYADLLVSGDFNGDGRLDVAATGADTSEVSIFLDDGNGTLSPPAEIAAAVSGAPVVADINGDGTDDVLVVNSAGQVLYRQGNPRQPGSFDPPVIVNPGFPSRDITWVPDSAEGPLLASVDVDDDLVSLYAFRDGGFIRVAALATGQLPAQIIAADLTGDGRDDLVVRNAVDGTISVFFNNGQGSFLTSFKPFRGPLTLSIGAGVSDVQAVDTTGDGRSTSWPPTR